MMLHKARQFKRGSLVAACLLCVCWALLPGGCGWLGGGGDYLTNISSPQPEVASKAMRKAAQNKNPQAIAPLVKRLYDEDSAMRISAIKALESITGQNMGYRSYDTEPKRMAAIERWEAYLVQEGLSKEPQEAPQND